MLPFTSLDPHLSDSAYAAYEAACRKLETMPAGDWNAPAESVVRRHIADALISAMRSGERDPDRLKALALAALAHR